MKTKLLTIITFAALLGCTTTEQYRYFRYNPVTHAVDQTAPEAAYEAGNPSTDEKEFHLEAERETAKREAWLESHGMRHVEFQDIPINAPETGTRRYPDGTIEHVYIPAP